MQKDSQMWKRRPKKRGQDLIFTVRQISKKTIEHGKEGHLCF
jgi:hypothetical protein